jgi:hypothetical protein
MCVPKAAMDKDRPFARLVGKIRFSGKTADMLPEPEPKRMYSRSGQDFRARVLRPDPRHHLRARERLALSSWEDLWNRRWHSMHLAGLGSAGLRLIWQHTFMGRMRVAADRTQQKRQLKGQPETGRPA